MKLLAPLLEGMDPWPGKDEARRWQQGDHLMLLDPHRFVNFKYCMLILVLESQQQGNLKFFEGYLIQEYEP